jgi:hypothetical protein
MIFLLFDLIFIIYDDHLTYQRPLPPRSEHISSDNWNKNLENREYVPSGEGGGQEIEIGTRQRAGKRDCRSNERTEIYRKRKWIQ